MRPVDLQSLDCDDRVLTIQVIACFIPANAGPVVCAGPLEVPKHTPVLHELLMWALCGCRCNTSPLPSRRYGRSAGVSRPVAIDFSKEHDCSGQAHLSRHHPFRQFFHLYLKIHQCCLSCWSKPRCICRYSTLASPSRPCGPSAGSLLNICHRLPQRAWSPSLRASPWAASLTTHSRPGSCNSSSPPG